MCLLEQYKKLLLEYDKVLNLSKMILAELKNEGEEKDIISLLGKKRKVGETITHLTKKIASSEIKSYSDSNLSSLAEVKDFLNQITEKAKLVQEVEDKIQNLLQQKDPR